MNSTEKLELIKQKYLSEQEEITRPCAKEYEENSKIREYFPNWQSFASFCGMNKIEPTETNKIIKLKISRLTTKHNKKER